MGTLGLSISAGDPAAQTFTGLPREPVPTGPVSLTGDARTVDLCPLIDVAWLRQFGEPRVTRGSYINGCQARIDLPGGGEAGIDLYFADYQTPAEDLGGTVQSFGGLSVVRDRAADPDPREGRCRRAVVLTDDRIIYVEAHSDAPDPPDLCTLADVATRVAVATLARDGLTHDPRRVAAYSLARGDACEVLKPDALRTVPGLEIANRDPGFANWTCFWGSGDQGDPQVVTRFRLDTADLERNYGESNVLGDEYVYTRSEGGPTREPGCAASVIHRRPTVASESSEIFSVRFESGDPEALDCQRARELAVAALPNLPEP